METALTHETFSKLLNTNFAILNAENGVKLELIEVSELIISPRQERFSLVFRGPKEVFLGQGMRRLKHPQMGEFDLFLVPIGENAQGYSYEVVFNRLGGN